MKVRSEKEFEKLAYKDVVARTQIVIPAALAWGRLASGGVVHARSRAVTWGVDVFVLHTCVEGGAALQRGALSRGKRRKRRKEIPQTFHSSPEYGVKGGVVFGQCRHQMMDGLHCIFS